MIEHVAIQLKNLSSLRFFLLMYCVCTMSICQAFFFSSIFWLATYRLTAETGTGSCFLRAERQPQNLCVSWTGAWSISELSWACIHMCCMAEGRTPAECLGDLDREHSAHSSHDTHHAECKEQPLLLVANPMFCITLSLLHTWIPYSSSLNNQPFTTDVRLVFSFLSSLKDIEWFTRLQFCTS